VARLVHYMKLGVTRTQLELTLEFKGYEDHAYLEGLVALAEERASFQAPTGPLLDLSQQGGGPLQGGGPGAAATAAEATEGYVTTRAEAAMVLERLGVDQEQAAFWRREHDPMEEEYTFEYFNKMVAIGVPMQAVEAKFDRDGEEDGTFELCVRLHEFRKYFGPPSTLGAADEPPGPQSAADPTADPTAEPTTQTGASAGASAGAPAVAAPSADRPADKPADKPADRPVGRAAAALASALASAESAVRAAAMVRSSSSSRVSSEAEAEARIVESGASPQESRFTTPEEDHSALLAAVASAERAAYAAAEAAGRLRRG